MIGYHFFFIFYIIFACHVQDDQCITFCLTHSQDKTITGPTITVTNTFEIQNTVEILKTELMTLTETETETETVSLSSSSLAPNQTSTDEDPDPFVFFPVVVEEEDESSTTLETTSSQESEDHDHSTSQELNEQASSQIPCESTPVVEG